MAKRVGGVTQAVEYLPSKCEALSSNPVPPKKFKKILLTTVFSAAADPWGHARDGSQVPFQDPWFHSLTCSPASSSGYFFSLYFLTRKIFILIFPPTVALHVPPLKRSRL
jgi:hypothetical protein